MQDTLTIDELATRCTKRLGKVKGNPLDIVARETDKIQARDKCDLHKALETLMREIK